MFKWMTKPPKSPINIILIVAGVLSVLGIPGQIFSNVPPWKIFIETIAGFFGIFLVGLLVWGIVALIQWVIRQIKSS